MLRYITQYYSNKSRHWTDFGIAYDTEKAALAVIRNYRREERGTQRGS